VFSKKQQHQQHPHNTPKAHFECLMKKQQQPPTPKKSPKNTHKVVGFEVMIFHQL
jgi:hypothetical protein